MDDILSDIVDVRALGQYYQFGPVVLLHMQMGKYKSKSCKMGVCL